YLKLQKPSLLGCIKPLDKLSPSDKVDYHGLSTTFGTSAFLSNILRWFRRFVRLHGVLTYLILMLIRFILITITT
ncbi:MAG: hypothetical protein WBE34_05070, partial [Candidatus Nitrosopolaris sp.]